LASIQGGIAAAEAQEQRTLQSGGFERSYLLAGAQRGSPRPLILALHGNGGTGGQLMRHAPWPQLVASGGMALALPDGLNRGWADGRPDSQFRGRKPPAGLNDVAFLMDLIDALVKEGIADRRKVYVMGVSNGGMMALRLLCDQAERFAAGAAVIASLPEANAQRCKPSRPVPLLLMNGTSDKLVPEQPLAGQYLGTEATAAFWRRANRCGASKPAQELADSNPNDGSRVIVTEAQCPAGQDVVVYRVVGGGHQVPSISGPPLLERLLGPRNRDIEGIDVIWSFLQRFSR
jgi:polyhydroxybutyrate depolymerase